ncbi:alpha/beta-hydrolase [Daedaleopsis nitida]|nr:alpha/beta-hydrolase [Daedaleopsis nitida]
MAATTFMHDMPDGLPNGIASQILAVRDLEMHYLVAGQRNAPLLVLLHGFPELSYSWRCVILPLANLGYRVVAPDLRGYGRTKPRDPTAPGAGRQVRYDDDLRPFRMLNLVHDVVALVYALGYTSVASLIGHDFGSNLAGYCAIVRPELFRTVVMMSAPFTGAPGLPFAIDAPQTQTQTQTTVPPVWVLVAHVDAALGQLDPPRKHYMRYFAGPDANADMLGAPQGLHAFLRSYFHIKSADEDTNDPHPIPLPPSPEGIAVLPHYYVMPRDAGMADVARSGAPSAQDVETKSSRWLPDESLAVYVRDFGRTGFQGGLNWYRGMIEEATAEELSLFAGARIDVPAMFLSGKKDWGVYQQPGALRKLQKELCAQMKDEDVVLVEGAGHWVQQEQPEEVVNHIRRFLKKL